MDKFKKIYYGDSHRKIRKKINDFLNDLDSETEELLMKIILKYQKTKDISNKDLIVVIDFIYNILSEVYKITSSELKKLYSQIKDFDIENILELTFNDDGKTLNQRVESYIKEIPDHYEMNYTKTNDHLKATSLTFSYIKSKIDRIIYTESYQIESQVKKIKKPIRASLLIIEAGCGDLCQGGEYPADEDVDLPPFHPNCQCIWYYDETDDLDDIEDLDLEVED